MAVFNALQRLHDGSLREDVELIAIWPRRRASVNQGAMSLPSGKDRTRYRPFFENKAIQDVGDARTQMTLIQSMKKPSSSLFRTLKLPMPSMCARPFIGSKSWISRIEPRVPNSEPAKAR